MELQREYEVYLANKPRLLQEHAGKFVLIKDDKIIETFTSYEDALKFGLGKFGNVPFLIKQIIQDEPVLFFHGVDLPCPA